MPDQQDDQPQGLPPGSTEVFVEEVRLTADNAEHTLRSFLSAVSRFTQAISNGRSFDNPELMHRVIRELAILIENVLPRLREEADRFELQGLDQLSSTLTALINELEDRHLEVLRAFLSRAQSDPYNTNAPLQ